jgi:selenocysteine lyase/cysteine desulfurase
MQPEVERRIERFRRLFPIVGKSLYLNHAAVSPFSLRVGRAMRSFIKARTESENVDLYPAVVEKIEEVRALLARLVGAPKDSIALVKNTSEGLNILASGFPWRPGDRILLFEREFPANVYPFLNVGKLGVSVDFVQEREGRFRLADVERAILPETRMLSVSHVEFLTGFRHDLRALGEMCRSKGVVFCVDAIQSAGVVPIDVSSMHIDFLACGGHKWLMGPMGTGFLFISPGLLDILEPAYAGWLSVENAWDFFDYDLRFLPSARRFEYATQNFVGFWGLRESVGLLLEVGFPNLTERIHMTTWRLIDGLRRRGIEIITPLEERARAGIVTFTVPDVKCVFGKLQDRKVFISLRDGLLRVSPHFYNTLQEMDMFLKALDQAMS